MPRGRVMPRGRGELGRGVKLNREEESKVLRSEGRRSEEEEKEEALRTGSAVWLRPHVDEVFGGLSHRLGGRGVSRKEWALVGQDGGLKAFSFSVHPLAA